MASLVIRIANDQIGVWPSAKIRVVLHKTDTKCGRVISVGALVTFVLSRSELALDRGSAASCIARGRLLSGCHRLRIPKTGLAGSGAPARSWCDPAGASGPTSAPSSQIQSIQIEGDLACHLPWLFPKTGGVVDCGAVNRGESAPGCQIDRPGRDWNERAWYPVRSQRQRCQGLAIEDHGAIAATGDIEPVLDHRYGITCVHRIQGVAHLDPVGE